MPRLGLKFLDGPARQEQPMRVQLDELSQTWHVVFRLTGSFDKQTAVCERVDVSGDGTVGTYRHVETLDEVRRNQ